ncbi:MAG: F0F1 ATP synthase subunit A [Succiniclasticum sp.]|jgi:F-type H+-transporting ATPase subunit a|nr:F0F1 ATP synthase subunit A [Succiniclasticum sp.]MCI6222471.1 F0F1 ATP synthase subunit A [Selenomonadales bacterium]MDY2869889.1 F0F1 ATP synthase subunit A [Succiniclasticum sp.]MDY6303637.1 F0F1 ATP synthase subunit A [Succiniclasticum sp.]MDY6345593.1 F0F1 ATP synthase subunit A [Succiniclasticum sp.]
MGTAEQASNEIIHYLPMQLDFLGMTVRMQTLYMSWLACILTIVIVWCITSGSKMIPGRAQVALEMFFDALGGLIESNLGKEGREKLQAFFFTLFLYLFVSNELGVFLPSIGVHFTSPTNDVNTVFALSILVMVIAYIYGIGRNGIHYFGHFVKPYLPFLPLNLIEEIAKPVTLALRLFGNILAGEILLIVLYKLCPWVIPDIWVLFSLFVGVLQAFVFTMLSIINIAPSFVKH